MNEEQVQWLSPDEQAAWRGYMRMNQLLLTQIDRDLWAESKLSGADYAVLVTLSEDADHQVRMSELAKRITWSKSRLSHQVSRMEKRGLVERSSCGDDGRGAWLSLTPLGMTTIEKAAPAHVASVRRNFISHLDSQHLESLTALTKVVNEKLGDIEVDESLCESVKQCDEAVTDEPREC